MATPSIRDVHDVDSQLPALRTEVREEVLLPGDEDYDTVRSVWNGMIDRRPALIVRSTGTADVVAAVNYAREHGLELAGGRYGNFPGFAEDPVHLLFGDNYDRSVELKREYDPENLLHLNQSIASRTGTA